MHVTKDQTKSEVSEVTKGIIKEIGRWDRDVKKIRNRLQKHIKKI